MNVEIIKNQLASKLNSKVKITVYGLRNKTDYFEGTLYKIYPNIFTIKYKNEEKSFAYRDILTKDINVKFL